MRGSGAFPQRFRRSAIAALAVAVVACGGDDGTGPNGGKAGPAASMALHAGNGQTAAAGTAVAAAPAVRVLDASNRPVAGHAVTFAVTAGAGSVSQSAATTDANGVATAGAWTLGTTVGANTLVASSSGLASVNFSATAIAGPPAQVHKVRGDTQSVVTGAAVPEPPAVRVTDLHGNAVAGVSVVFTVGTGGGSVSGGTVTSDAEGVAAVGAWTLGATPGSNTLNATAGSLAPATFTATALDPCDAEAPITVGTPASGELKTIDCRFSTGEYVDYFRLQLASAASLRIAQTSSAIDSYVIGYDSTHYFVGYNDDQSSNTQNAAFRLLAAPGRYILAATSFGPGEIGAYSLAVTDVPAEISDCPTDDFMHVWATRGITTTQQVQATNCSTTIEGAVYYSDRLIMRVVAGRTYTITMLSTAIDPWLTLFVAGSGEVIGENDDGGGGTTARLVHTPTANGYIVIDASTAFAQTTGAYTLTIQ